MQNHNGSHLNTIGHTGSAVILMVSQDCHCGGPGSNPGQVGFMMNEVTLGPVLSEYFGFP
jgi:hypothetical protein